MLSYGETTVSSRISGAHLVWSAKQFYPCNHACMFISPWCLFGVWWATFGCMLLAVACVGVHMLACMPHMLLFAGMPVHVHSPAPSRVHPSLPLPCFDGDQSIFTTIWSLYSFIATLFTLHMQIVPRILKLLFMFSSILCLLLALYMHTIDVSALFPLNHLVIIPCEQFWSDWWTNPWWSFWTPLVTQVEESWLLVHMFNGPSAIEYVTTNFGYWILVCSPDIA